MSNTRTYWHLEESRRKPSEYDISTSKLLYHPEKGFEVQTPLSEWYRKNQRDSAFRCSDWEQFADPREKTYSKYTTVRTKSELFIEGLFERIDIPCLDSSMSPTCKKLLENVFAPMRYPLHGMQMVAAYVGSMAPSGRIVITSLFQAADEMRRIQRIAYRIRQIQEGVPTFAANSKEIWQNEPHWQPWRKVIERLLCTFDWGEAFVALNTVVKPAFDELFMVEFGKAVSAAGEPILQSMLGALNEDCIWQREWTQALLDMVSKDNQGDDAVVKGWREKWAPDVLEAVNASTRAIDALGGVKS